MTDQSKTGHRQSRPQKRLASFWQEVAGLFFPGEFIFAVLVVLLLSGCGMVTSEAPITGLIATAPDASLPGQWRGAALIEGGGPASLDIVAIEPGVYQITFVAGDPRFITNRFGGDGSLIAHTSSLRGTRFLNIRVADDQESFLSGKPRYILVRYAVQDGNRLVMWTISQQTARDAVARGLIAGEQLDEASQGTRGPSVRLTATSPDLRKYLRDAGPLRVFSEYAGRFQRVEPGTRLVAANIARAVRDVADQATRQQ